MLHVEGRARMNARVRGTSLALAWAIVFAILCVPDAASLPSVKERKPAPDFALVDASGAPIQLSAYKGRVVLLDFWATWCTGCKVEIPWYMEFQTKYARQGLTSIGVAMDEEGWRVVKPYLSQHPITYPIVLGNPDLVQPYHITSMPVT